jgi:hypothetical protein
MEVKVFATQDGALVVVTADTVVSDDLLRIGALHHIGDGCVPAALLSDELVSLLTRGGPAVAQPTDVQPVLRAITSRALSARPPLFDSACTQASHESQAG